MSAPTGRRGVGCGVAIGAAAIALFVLIVGVAFSYPKGTHPSNPFPSNPATQRAAEAATPEPTESPKPAGPATSFGDGVFIVGTDIVAGKYKSAGPKPGGDGKCVWFRRKDTTGDRGTIIARNISRGPQTVTISRTDGAFESFGCQDWRKVG
ncbi:MAG TPA: hypothetical protein VFO16_15645 [Pseudonocardiaceae bacterium]|nr:hypothetical protein [Pseudonocardiaceae bacterium]